MNLTSFILRTLGPTLAVIALASPGLARAQAWPNKTVRIVVPFSVGAAADALTRIVAQALSQNTAQPFVVENKTGAAGSLGAGEVARAAPDGYTLLLGTPSTHSIAQHVSKLPYNVVEDFTPIALVAETNAVLLVSPSIPATNLKELFALAREKPGFLNYASSGIGSWGHLSFELLEAQSGLRFTHVPYRGTGSSITDLTAGNVHMALDSVATAMPHVKGGRLRGLGVSGPKRSALAPDIPTIGELVPGFALLSWFGLYGPRGMAPEVVRRINDEVNKVLQSPDVVARFNALGVESGRGSGGDFAAYVAADSARWARIIKERNIKVN